MLDEWVCELFHEPGEECHHLPKPNPVEVTVLGKVDRTHEEAADYGSYSRWDLTFSAAGLVPPVAILQHDEKRSRALIWVTTGTVLLGDKNRVAAGQGILIPTTVPPIEICNKQEIWAIASGADAVMNVINERWK